MNQKGFTYIFALTLVMIIGIMLAMTGQSWQMVMKREKEKELLFRGNQIKEAIENWYNPMFPSTSKRNIFPLNSLNELLSDPHSQNLHFLRRLYQDPLTREDWVVIRGSVTTSSTAQPVGQTFNGIIGVASTSREKPLKTSFADYSSLSRLGEKKSDPGEEGFKERPVQYRDWQFIADVNNDQSKLYNSYREGW